MKSPSLSLTPASLMTGSVWIWRMRSDTWFWTAARLMRRRRKRSHIDLEQPLLIPQNRIKGELGAKRRQLGLREMALLKTKYGISMQALLRRCRDLNIITESAYRNIFRYFSSMGWRKQEPVQYKGNEKPEKLKQMLLRTLAEQAGNRG